MHKLLARQLRRTFPENFQYSAEMSAFIKLIDEAYRGFDSDRQLSERSMHIASTEMMEQNQALQQKNHALQSTHDKLRDEITSSEALLELVQILNTEQELQKVLEAVCGESSRQLRAEFGVCFVNSKQQDGSFVQSSASIGLNCVKLPNILKLVADMGKDIESHNDSGLAANLLNLISSGTTTAEPDGKQSIKTAILLPMTSRTGQTLGGILVGTSQENVQFGEREERIVQSIAVEAAIAIDNVHLLKASQEANELLTRQALYDPLTELPNRVLFRQRLTSCIERSRDRTNYHYAVIFLDLDRFKIVNDTLGHETGDRLLVGVAARLRACLRSEHLDPNLASNSTIARMGGDEFMILLDDLKHQHDAIRVAERIVEYVAQPYQIDSHEVAITTCVGVAMGSPQFESADEITRSADAAMYHAKGNGKNQYAVFDAGMRRSLLHRARIERDLRRAIKGDEFRLYYQPIVNLSDRTLKGFEALIRWERDGKMLSPAEFIPIAEECGLINMIGLWVMREACTQLGKWQRQFKHFENVTMSVNLSRAQLVDTKLPGQVKKIIDEAGIDAQSLKLEVTESMIMPDMETSIATMREMIAYGVGFEMDDFGVGYSSLANLNSLPIEIIKIDRSFLRSAGTGREQLAVLAAIVNLAHNLKMKVVAEGLELPEQIALVQCLDCDYGQGYYFSQPLLASDAANYLISAPVLSIAA